MIQILYFARLRDELGLEREELEIPNADFSVDDLKRTLYKRGSQWQDVLSNDSLLIAVNQTMADAGTKIKPGDEVGIFPPVTGG